MNGLNIEMQEIKGTATTETLLKSILQEAIKCCIPHKTARAKTNKLWIIADLFKLIGKRHKTCRKMNHEEVRMTGTER